MKQATGIILAFSMIAGSAAADQVRITQEMARKEIRIGNQTMVIERNQDVAATISQDFAKTSRPCPPFCIAPMIAGPGVETLGELEVISFLETHVAKGSGILMDSRLPEFFQKGAIPGAVNVPFTTLDPANPYLEPILEALGAVRQGGAWNFDSAQHLALYCNGPWCEQSPRAIGNLLDVGYPAAKLKYYRGGMQNWQALGLTVVEPPATN
jgi:rhodanese-related sulfurtransferase